MANFERASITKPNNAQNAQRDMNESLSGFQQRLQQLQNADAEPFREHVSGK